MSYMLISRSHKTPVFTLTLALIGLLNPIAAPALSNPTATVASKAANTEARLKVNAPPAREDAGKSEELKALASESVARVPLSFQPNVGQMDARASFLARGNGYNLFLTPAGPVFDLMTTRACGPTNMSASSSARRADSPCKTGEEAARVGLKMEVVGASPASQLAAQEELPTRVNYFIGNDPEKWRSRIPTFARIAQRNVYAGIDLFYYGNQRQLEYDFVVAPRADYGLIRLRFEGANSVRIDGAGDLLLQVNGGSIKHRKPVVYQEAEGGRREVAGSYVIFGKNEVGFRVGEYDASLPLVIDPVLIYSTYLGGNMADEAVSVTANSSSIFISGSTGSTARFPATTGAFQTSYAGGPSDAFVAKLNHISPSAPFFNYITYLGGNSNDHGYGIACDDANNAYVVGDTTSTNFPTTPGSFRSTLLPGLRYIDGFVTKLSPDGSALVYSTYLGGGDGYDHVYDIDVDATGAAYITGDTTSPDFPRDESGAVRTTPGGFPRHFVSEFDPPDAFVLGLNAAGSDLIYTTFLGGPNRTDRDIGYGIAVGLGNQFVTGMTSSTFDFPLANPFQSPGGGGAADVFVARLEYLDGHLFLRYSTYLGGNNDDQGKDIAVDSTGKVYVTGYSNSANFPTRNALQPIFRGGTCGASPRFVCHEAFVVKIDPYLAGNSSFLYGSYLGGRGDDVGNGITIDSANNVYLTGATDSIDFPTMGFVPTTSRPLRSDYTGAGDAFITKLNAVGIDNFSYGYSAYLGGFFDALTHIELSREFGNGVALDSFGDVYVVGQTTSNRFANGTVPYPSYNGGGDAFVVKIQESPSDRMGSMMGLIEMLVKDGQLSEEDGKSLLVKLQVAVKQLEKGNVKPSVNQLEAFVARVDELIKSGALQSKDGKVLIDRATEVINQLAPYSKPSK
jgi:hypothetical protein